MTKNTATKVKSIKLVTFGKNTALAGAVPRTLSGQEAGRVLGFGCNHY
ncbi:hypothetical protein [Yersinia wautersii]|uniref:Uncharacterized protein n=1 Tax=Yersinia wautersii TaxID=1341643 RepID=A0ABP1ZH81_9GAMM|nr:hypothetical protein [Yersinia wautersii]CRG50513.1 Uncharacterised protein [Yersinia wautersii]